MKIRFQLFIAFCFFFCFISDDVLGQVDTTLMILEEIEGLKNEISNFQVAKKEVDVFLKNVDLQSNAIALQSTAISRFSIIATIVLGIAGFILAIMLAISVFGYFNYRTVNKELKRVDDLKIETEQSRNELQSIIDEGKEANAAATEFFNSVEQLRKEVKEIDIPVILDIPTDKEEEEIIYAKEKIVFIKAIGKPLNEKENLILGLSHFYKGEYEQANKYFSIKTN